MACNDELMFLPSLPESALYAPVKFSTPVQTQGGQSDLFTDHSFLKEITNFNFIFFFPLGAHLGLYLFYKEKCYIFIQIPFL